MQRQSAAGAIVGLVFATLAVIALGILVSIEIADIPGGNLSPLALPTLIATGLLLPIAVLLAFFLTVKIANVARAGALARLHPEAYLAQIAVTGALRRQLTKLAAALGLATPRLRRTRYATLVADRSSIRIFQGSRDPHSRLRLPVSALSSAAVEDREIGVAVVTAITLEFAGEGGHAELDVVPIDTTGLFARTLHGGAVTRELTRLLTATHLD